MTSKAYWSSRGSAAEWMHESMWDSAHVLLASTTFRDQEGFAARDEEILDYLTSTLGPEIRNRVGLLQTMSLKRYQQMDLRDHLREISERLGITDVH